jgi:SAM-dependent methyltransferase
LLWTRLGSLDIFPARNGGSRVNVRYPGVLGKMAGPVGLVKHSGYYTLAAVSLATAYHRWVLKRVGAFVGQRVLEAGCGIGNFSALLLDRQRLVLADHEPAYIHALRRRFGGRQNVRIDLADLTEPGVYQRWNDERLDTIFCSNVLEHLRNDEEVLGRFHQTLRPGGHCVIVVPAGRWLYCGMDKELGHCRRYTRQELFGKMTAAGFEVVFTRQFCRLGALAWAICGGLLGRRGLGPRQMTWFDRLLPLVKLLDYLLPVPGMSLIMVGRKPDRAVWRMAA